MLLGHVEAVQTLLGGYWKLGNLVGTFGMKPALNQSLGKPCF